MAILVREEGKQNGHILESLDVPLWTVILSLFAGFPSPLCRGCVLLLLAFSCPVCSTLLTRFSQGSKILLLASILTSPTLTSFTPNLWFLRLPDILSKVCQRHLQFNKSKNNLDHLSSSSTNFCFLDSIFLYGKVCKSKNQESSLIPLPPSSLISNKSLSFAD